MSNQMDKIDYMADALRKAAGRKRAWKRLTDGERRQWRIRARMITDSARRQWPDDFEDSGSPPMQFDPAEVQAANNHLEIAGGERAVLDTASKRIVREKITENVKNCPLIFYAARGYITGMQRDAGLRLYALFVAAGREGPGAAPLDGDRVDSSNKFGVSDYALVASDEYKAAQNTVGPELWPIVRAVCIEEKTAQAFAKSKKINPPRAAMVLLHAGLDALVRAFNNGRDR